MGLNADLAGKVYPARTFDVTVDGIRRYAQATNEDNPQFLSDSPVGPPAFPCVAGIDLLNMAMYDPDLGVDMAMLVHAEQEHLFHCLVRAGQTYVVESRLEKVDLAETGHSFTLLTTMTDEAGVVASEVWSTMFIRRSGTIKPAKVDDDTGETVYEGTMHVDQDQTVRYAEASGDHNPIHLDREAARSSGFPGVILHGMCTMAMASKVVLDGAAGGDMNRLRKIRVQFSRPVFPGQELTTRVWRRPEPAEGLSEYGFETVNQRGAVVLKNGLAVVAGS